MLLKSLMPIERELWPTHGIHGHSYAQGFVTGPELHGTAL